MAATEQVMVSLGADLVADIDRITVDRSRFISDAVRHELLRRRLPDFVKSLEDSHPETEGLGETGLDEWAGSLPIEANDLVDTRAGTPVRWIPGTGWIENDT